MLKKTMWYSIGIVAILSAILFIGGFVTSLAITTGKIAKGEMETMGSAADRDAQNGKFQELNSEGHHVLIIGDSLAKGTGDEKGLGFTNDYIMLLKTKVKKDIKVTNIAVNGDKSEDLLQIIENQQTWPAIESSETIFISIGGNEIRQFKNNELETASAIKETQNNYLENLRKIIKRIREENKSCTVVCIGLYNPFDTDSTPEKVKLLSNWNYETEQILANDNNAVLIPTYDIFKYNLQKYLSVDKLHPNSVGYEAISKRIVEVLKNF